MKKPRPSPLWVWSPYAGQSGRAFVTRIDGLSDPASTRLLLGEPLGRVPRLTLRDYEPGEFTDALGAYTGLLLLAPVLVEVLRAARAPLQLVPLAIPQRPDLAYAIVNVLERAPALDLARSKLTMFPDTDIIASVSKLALRPLAPAMPPIFHAAEHPLLVLVTDDLRQRLQAASPSPGVLTPVEEWRNDR